MKFERVKAGMVLYDVRREKQGNTTIRDWGYWTVHVLGVDGDGATVSWNGSRACWKPARYFKRLREKKPTECSECRSLVGHLGACSRRRTRAP